VTTGSGQEPGVADIAKVRGYFDAATNERVSDEWVLATLDWFRRDSQRHMLAARAISRSLSLPGATP
jgi:hypothetical protein